jgi:hypothetical protein
MTSPLDQIGEKISSFLIVLAEYLTTRSASESPQKAISLNNSLSTWRIVNNKTIESQDTFPS